MGRIAIAYVATAVVFLVLDGGWLALVGPRLYKPEIGSLLADKVRFGPAIVFYLLYIAGLVAFVVQPSLAAGWTRALIWGAAFGVVTYACYDLTCAATMRTWSMKVTVADIVWGAVASGIAAAAGTAIVTRTADRFLAPERMTSLPYEHGLSTAPPAIPHESAAFRAMAAALKRYWSIGGLTLVGPAGSLTRIEGAERGLEARLEVKDGRFMRRVLASGDIGFADSYVAGEWDTPDLATCLITFAANFDAIGAMMKGNPVLRLAQAVAHALNGNSRSGSRRNIYAHYDLGDAFYRLWLDEGMNYSSVLALPAKADLAAAQTDKHAALARSMELQRGQTVLEIGCGWGGFAEFAAREYDARVTAVTISPSQQAYAAQRIQEAGLSERVSVELRDYRDVEGRFDRVASIEMFEAVGERYWPAYFSTVRDRLTDSGRAGLQIITIDDALFETYRRRPDFIQLHVFPGGMLPSERRLLQETGAAGLRWMGINRFGQGYADTLHAWLRRFSDRIGEVRALVSTTASNACALLPGYCEAGFRTGRTDVIQLGLARS